MLKFWGILCLFVLTETSENSKRPFLVLNKKEFVIEGSSNVGKFVCKYELKGKDTLFLHSQEQKLSYELPIKNIGCGNLFISKNFKETLKGETFPKAKIFITNLRYFDVNDYICKAELHIVGKRIRFPNFLLRKEGEKLMGKVELKITDLGLKAPESVYGGLIRVNNKIRLNLSLQVQ